jgi:mannose-1-phosphate guanylyltransferase
MAGADTIHRKQTAQSSFAISNSNSQKLDCAAVILAGGEGVRLSSFTHQVFGYHIPKQFFPLFEGKTLLEQTMDRVELLIPRFRTITVLNRAHDRRRIFSGAATAAP